MTATFFWVYERLKPLLNNFMAAIRRTFLAENFLLHHNIRSRVRAYIHIFSLVYYYLFFSTILTINKLNNSLCHYVIERQCRRGGMGWGGKHETPTGVK